MINWSFAISIVSTIIIGVGAIDHWNRIAKFNRASRSNIRPWSIAFFIQINWKWLVCPVLKKKLCLMLDFTNSTRTHSTLMLRQTITGRQSYFNWFPPRFYTVATTRIKHIADCTWLYIYILCDGLLFVFGPNFGVWHWFTLRLSNALNYTLCAIVRLIKFNNSFDASLGADTRRDERFLWQMWMVCGALECAKISQNWDERVNWAWQDNVLRGGTSI